jgi:hypothetical protein
MVNIKLSFSQLEFEALMTFCDSFRYDIKLIRELIKNGQSQKIIFCEALLGLKYKVNRKADMAIISTREIKMTIKVIEAIAAYEIMNRMKDDSNFNIPFRMIIAKLDKALKSI